MSTEPLPLPAVVERKASLRDVPAMDALINFWAAQGHMLPKTRIELYEDIRDFWVAEDAGRIIACCALKVSWEDLAEVCSLAVDFNDRGRGIGPSLVKRCLDEARELGIHRVFGLTYEVRFFEKLGFHVVDKSTLPHKIWRQCVKCQHFPDCDETAVEIQL